MKGGIEMKKMEDLFLGGNSEWTVHYAFGKQNPYYYEKKSRCVCFQKWKKFLYSDGFIYAPFVFNCHHEDVKPIYIKITIKNRVQPSLTCCLYLWRSPLLGWFHVDHVLCDYFFQTSGVLELASKIEKELLCNY